MALEGTRGGVPRVVAGAPWEDAGEGLEEVEEGPRDDDVVVDAADARDQHHAYAETWREETQFTTYEDTLTLGSQTASPPGCLDPFLYMFFSQPWTSRYKLAMHLKCMKEVN